MAASDHGLMGFRLTGPADDCIAKLGKVQNVAWVHFWPRTKKNQKKKNQIWHTYESVLLVNPLVRAPPSGHRLWLFALFGRLLSKSFAEMFRAWLSVLVAAAVCSFSGSLSEARKLRALQDDPLVDCGGLNNVIDIIWVVDESGSVGEANYNELKKFIVDVSNEFAVSPLFTRMGLIEFSGQRNDVINLNARETNDAWNAGVNDLAFTGGGTATLTAMRFLNTNYLERAQNQKRSNVQSRRIVIMATDGEPSPNTGEGAPGDGDDLLVAEVSSILAGDVDRFIFLRIGDKVNEDIFNDVVGFEKDRDLIEADFNDLESVLEPLVGIVQCESPVDEDDDFDFVPFLLIFGGLIGAAALLTGANMARRKRNATLGKNAFVQPPPQSFRSKMSSVRSWAPSVRNSTATVATDFSDNSRATNFTHQSIARPPPPPVVEDNRATRTTVRRWMTSVRQVFYDPRETPSYVKPDGKVVGWVGGT